VKNYSAIRKLGLFLGVVTMAAGLVGCGGGGGDEEAMTSEEWSNTIHMGMTQDEVIAAVGRPPDRQYNDSRFITPNPFYAWRFGNDEGAVAYGVDGRVARFSYATHLYGT